MQDDGDKSGVEDEVDGDNDGDGEGEGDGEGHVGGGLAQLMEAMGDEDDVKKEGLDDDHHHPTHPIQVSQNTHKHTHVREERRPYQSCPGILYTPIYIHACVCARARACVRALGYICMRRI
jgi:hypothetical protein